MTTWNDHEDAAANLSEACSAYLASPLPVPVKSIGDLAFFDPTIITAAKKAASLIGTLNRVHR